MSRTHTPTRTHRRTGLLAAFAVLATTLAVLCVPTTAHAASVQITPGADAVTASTSDDNEPGNVVDDDYTTRWSGEGDGAWLQLDLGSTKTVTHVKVAVYKGDTRQNVFELQYWDGSDWVTVFDGESSGDTTGLETFDFDPVETSMIRYLGHGYVDDEGTGDWNSLTEVEIWGSEDGNGGGDDGGDAEVPADVLDLTNWKLTLPTGEEEDPTEITQPELDSYSSDPYFTVTESGDAVQFRAPVNGVTTSGSSNPRSELREMENDGEDNASWSSTSGTHTMTVREAFTHLPEDRPYVVGAQIHGGDDDVTALRLEDTDLYITKGDTTHYELITSDYELGTVFELTYVVSEGEIEVYYNDDLQTTISDSGSGNYFKTGAYTQANCENSSPCSSDNYGEVEIYDVTVSHS